MHRRHATHSSDICVLLSAMVRNGTEPYRAPRTHVVPGPWVAKLDVKAASIVVKRMWLIGVLALVYSAGSIRTAVPKELCRVIGWGSRVRTAKCGKGMKGIPDGGKGLRIAWLLTAINPILGVREFNTRVANAELGGGCADHPVELYYDDTWAGYRGTWLIDRRASQWTVVLTLLSSVFATAAGYWLFGIGYTKRSGD
jgi:hypothetical protein